MDSETTATIPVIDFTNINLEGNINSPNWESVKSQVHEALVEYGFFEAIFNKVPLDLRKATFPALEELFNLPLHTKQLNIVSSKPPFHSYMGQRPGMPLYESMAFHGENVSEKVENMTNIFWPNGNSSFSKTMNSFSEQLYELDQIIRKMLFEKLGVEKYFEEHNQATNYILRVTKYKGLENSVTNVGLGSHRDKNFVTILHQNQVEGLELQTKDGKWLSYKPFQDSFVVVIGESLQALLNGRLHLPHHKVVLNSNEVRYSIGLFSIPKDGCIVKAPEELVDEEYPLLFKPFDYAKFIEYFLSKEGIVDPFPLRTYCGI